MISTPAVRNLVRENKIAQLYSVIQTSTQYGMQTMEMHLNSLISSNMIDPKYLKHSGTSFIGLEH